MGIYKITIINKGIKIQYDIFVVPGNRPALLGMPHCQRLHLPSINHITTDADQNGRQVNEQTKQVKKK